MTLNDLFGHCDNTNLSCMKIAVYSSTDTGVQYSYLYAYCLTADAMS